MQAEKLDDFEEDGVLPFNFILKISQESIRENWKAIREAIEKLEQDSDSL